MANDLLAAAGRVVMVSGAARGIGASVARRLYEDGYRVSLGARVPAAALAALGPTDPARAMAARFDATVPETARTWLDATIETFGQLDALVNNAGILRQVSFDDSD